MMPRRTWLHATALGLVILGGAINADSAVDWSRVEDDPTRRVTLTWLGCPYFGIGHSGGAIQREIERRFNVELRPIFLDPLSYQRRKPMLMAGGEGPDVIYEFSDSLRVDAWHGLLLELPLDVLQRWAPHAVRKATQIDPRGWLATKAQGKNYGLPLSYTNGLRPVPGVWRADWLRRVGLTAPPATLDEWEDTLRRMRQDDPDGNGKRDTYGMSGDTTDWWWTSFGEIFGAFGVLPYDWMRVDGRVVYGGIQPSTREALALLRRWHAEDLIDPEFATDRQRQGGSLEQKFLRGKLAYIYYNSRYSDLDMTLPGSLGRRLLSQNPKAEIVPGKFPSGPEGKSGGRVQGAAGTAISFGAHLAKDPVKVVRVLRMLDAMAADPTLGVALLAGEQGVHWDFLPAAPSSRRSLRPLPPFDDPSRATRAVLSFNLGAGGFFHPDALDPAALEAYLSPDEATHDRTVRPRSLAMMNVIGRTESLPSATRYWSRLRQIQQLIFTEIIRGTRPLDAFDEFVATWHREGGDVLEREAVVLWRELESISPTTKTP